MSNERDKNVAELKALWDEPNPNRESQQQYFGYGRVVNMSNNSGFGNNNNDNARQIQDAYANQAQQRGLGQQQFDPCYICRQKEEDLKKQLTEALATSSKMLEQKRDTEIEILQLKLEVAQLRLALAKAEK